MFETRFAPLELIRSDILSPSVSSKSSGKLSSNWLVLGSHSRYCLKWFGSIALIMGSISKPKDASRPHTVQSKTSIVTSVVAEPANTDCSHLTSRQDVLLNSAMRAPVTPTTIGMNIAFRIIRVRAANFCLSNAISVVLPRIGLASCQPRLNENWTFLTPCFRGPQLPRYSRSS